MKLAANQDNQTQAYSANQTAKMPQPQGVSNQSLSDEIAALKRRILGNQSKTPRRLSGSQRPLTPVEWATRTRENGTYTPGADWNLQFDGPNVAATNYIDTRQPGGGGYVEIGGNSGTRGYRARLVFDAEAPFETNLGVNMDSGLVQVQDNGRIQETATSAILVLQFYRGRNVLECMCDVDCIYARFRLTAIDGILSKGVKQSFTYI